MIDYEVTIFNRVHASVAPLCAKNRFVSTQITEPVTAFPAACLYEMDNATVRRRQSSTPGENYARITYVLEVYATTKAKCREVFAAADGAMIGMNFDRMSANFVPNMDNPKIFRMVGRYEADIDPDGNIYRIA